MAADWTLKVEDFGRIAAAEVTVKPLTVLVGRNNSGKSYLASLIWGTELGGWRDCTAPNDSLDALARRWRRRARQHDGTPVPWTDIERDAFRDAWPQFIASNRADFGMAIFGDDIWPASLHIDTQNWHDYWCLTSQGGSKESPFWLTPQDDTTDDRQLSSQKPHGGGAKVPLGAESISIGESILTGVALPGQRYGFTTRYSPFLPVFLPASRTGFSLFLPTFIQSSLVGAVRPRVALEGHERSFTLPQIHLLSALASGFGVQEGPFADESRRLEHECLEGIIKVMGPFGIANYRFQPTGSENAIALQHTSALVTELMPMVVALRNAQEIPFLVLEEPEAHLHPKLQRAVTRCLARLVRRGVRVLITTHSETVAQQINNLIKLESLDPEQRQRFGYDADEYLAVDEVGVHEFVFREDGRTVVETVQPGPSGFGMATFNEPLLQFAQETLALNALLEDEGSEEPG